MPSTCCRSRTCTATSGSAEEAYAWAARAYATWGREPDDRVLQVYAQNTLADNEGGHRARTLAEQAEAAMRARAFGQAAVLFQQALTFAPDNVYLQRPARRGARALAVEPLTDAGGADRSDVSK